MTELKSEGFLREQLDKSLKESKQLRAKIEVIDKENSLLKKSLYDLSLKYNQLAYKVFNSNQENLAKFTQFHPPQNTTILNPSSAAANTSLDLHAPDNLVEEDDHLSKNNTTNASRSDGKYFHLRGDIKAHTGAVYTTHFSPCGKFLSTGSFDKTVRVFNVTSSYKTPTESLVLSRHSLNISDLSWNSKSDLLLSASYDQTCKLWNLEQGGNLVGNYDADGFVQCVEFSSNDQIFYNGTSRNILGMYDTRTQASSPDTIFKNDSMINSLHVYKDGNFVLTADANGFLKTWDTRQKKVCVHSFLNESLKKSISHVATYDIDYDTKYVAVNSYANVIQIYERSLINPVSPYKLLSTLKGYKNKNWPIKSSFWYCKSGYRMKRTASHHDNTIGDADESRTFEADHQYSSNTPKEGTMFLATGSADPYAYVYHGVNGVTELLQRLEGHSDRVYSTSFHPRDPVLATCSADFTVKIWTIKK